MSGWRELWHVDFLGNELGAGRSPSSLFLVTFTVLPLAKRFISVSPPATHRPRAAAGHLAIDSRAPGRAHQRGVPVGVAVWVGSAT